MDAYRRLPGEQNGAALVEAGAVDQAHLERGDGSSGAGNSSSICKVHRWSLAVLTLVVCLSVAVCCLERDRTSRERALWGVDSSPEDDSIAIDLPVTQDEYDGWTLKFYSKEFSAIHESASARLASFPQCSESMTSAECAHVVYSEVRSPPVQGGCAFVVNRTMPELYDLAKTAEGVPMECVMKASIGIGVLIDCDTSFLARHLYARIDSEGNSLLLRRAADLPMKQQAELAVNYRTWAKTLIRQHVMRNEMHDDLGVKILDMREERKMGKFYIQPFFFECIQACEALGLPDCSSVDQLPKEEQLKVYSRVVEDARNTNVDVNAIVNHCPAH
mmetsp:Transcript_38843/g.91411  ORF Transcript_38843/g.91411 Transcript_38843/m.91411 type:complete len:332 (+) Transcript_38843:212-1207(+)|eukprot:CAMPEP_0178402600 /NCGR_PEP_ID=MMETSP0689_2-20121128/16926_1 /TAXON_ID=160604 /ORGANISM="Amphidinium massartii, Strain CS-259" /LENGTH=331 /DNA_ID=CAMNT_0020023507 /DNA_START=155 /DNA_END=1150 /DNA_ORIENTATION=-